MSDGCSKMLAWSAELLQQDEPDKALADRLRQREQVLDSVQDEVAEFVTHLLSGNVPHSVATEARRQMHMADEYESVSDYILDLDKFDRKLRKEGERFSEQQRTDLVKLNSQVSGYLTEVNQALTAGNKAVLTKTDPTAKRIRDEVKQLRQKHLAELSGGSIAPVVMVAWLASLNAYSKIREHTREIAEAISEAR